MLFIVSVILASAFFVSEWNDVVERTSWIQPDKPHYSKRFHKLVNVVCFGMIALTGIIMLAVLPKHTFDLLDWMIFFIFVWSALSITWATDKELCIQCVSCWLSVGCVIFGVGLTCSLKECAIVMASGCLFYFVAGLLHELYTHRLVFNHSYRFFGGVGCNRQGAEAILLSFLLIFLFQSGVVNGWLLMIGIFLTTAVVISARSRTGTWAAIAGFAAWALSNLPSMSAVIIVLGISLITICLIAAFPVLRKRTWALIMLGRKEKELTDLSGRTILWSFLWPFIRNRPLLGNGYGSTWTDKCHKDLFALQPFSIRISHAHSIYLDSFLNGGIIAFLLFVSILTIAGFSAFQAEIPTGPFIIGLVTYATVHGLGESTLALPLHRTFLFFGLLVSLQV